MEASREVETSSSEFIAYRLRRGSGMKLATAPQGRDWMNETNQGFANRCLPMRMASQSGWVVLNDKPLRAMWNGGSEAGALVIEGAGEPSGTAVSHFGHGILTFPIPFLFRTPPGTTLLIRGPANAPKDAIAPLEGLVETDWAVAGSTVNWKFTRPNTWVEFASGEPICMVVPQRLDLLEAMQPQVVGIEENAELHRQYKTWNESVIHFTQRLRERDPEAVKLGWQRYYFHGTAPHNGSNDPTAEGHRSRLSLREFAEGVAASPATIPAPAVQTPTAAVPTEVRNDFKPPHFRTKVVADFWPRANEARERYDSFMGNFQSHSFRSVHQCWDYWHVPNVYTYLRTDPAKVIGKELVDDFVKHLTTFCVEELAGLTPLPPWLTLHLNGMRHEIHNDGKNGSYGYVYSLTRSLEAFTGGETCVSREGVFDSLEPRQFKVWRGYFEVIPPLFNQLLLFDDRLAHMVPVVQGTMNPVHGRLCLTGHVR
jgi:hypothetical protein